VPADCNPALVYLASLAGGSRRTMKHALDTMARVVDSSLISETLPWHLVGFQHVMAIRAQLVERGYASSMINKMLSALRGTLRAAFNLGLMDGDQFARATGVKSVRGSRVAAGRALEPKEMRALYAVCDAGRPEGARNAAVLSLLYAAALRRSEVVALDRAHFDASSGRLRVRGKGNKERTVYLSNGGLLAVRAWLQLRGDQAGPLIHPVRKGGTIVVRRMDDQSILDLVRRLALRAKVAHFSPHDLRRTAVGDLLDSGVDLATAQKIAGHASPVTTATSYDRRGEKAKMKAAALLHVPFVAADPGSHGPGEEP
jgi:site-specific recombinase XerD